MKKIILSFVVTSMFFICIAQDVITDTKVKSLNGKEISFSNITNIKDTPVVVSFWATWCIPCVAELENINDEMSEWQSKTPFKFIGIATDDTRTSQRVKSFVKGKGWQFDVYTDANQELKRALSVTDVPHVLIIKNNKIRSEEHTSELQSH